MEEMLDVLDETGRPTGEIVPKGEVHRLGLWHRCFHCWICGSDAEGGYLLLQRRAATKDTWPCYLDITAAGHLAAGEETLDGLREVEEELGLRVDPARLVPLGTLRVEQNLPDGCDREFHEVFLLSDNTPPGDLRLQREEVDAVFRLSLEDVRALYETGSAPAREFAEGRNSPTYLRLTGFVPHEEGFLSRVAEAAGQLLSGSRPSPILRDASG